MINPIIMNLLFMVLRTDLDKKEGDLVIHGHDKNMRFEWFKFTNKNYRE
tara:strand:+ start:37 stop:183 length:147 start_codon:yes stop_codon:yes gene_type:complete